MSARVEIDFQGPTLESLRRALVVTLARVQDKNALGEEIGRALVDSTKARFRAQTAPDGTRWEPSLRVKAAKENSDVEDVTLTLSGNLRDSIDHALGPSSIEIGSNEAYAGVHQHGFDGVVTINAHTRQMISAFGKRLKQPVTANVGSHQRKMQMVERPYLGLSADDKADIRRILMNKLKGLQHVR
ncbi:phage virion morphogenesis protein [Shewanella xiamenensis]|uniref:phage virion morphogenesis protein n=1 Tax=Shewanella xiamenensis TaxID=332186 RepID=UPI0008498ACB|nr:phage virion morphogenesis protein [Shewanella xiamenensis]